MEQRLRNLLAGILALRFEAEEVTLLYHHWRISLRANAGLRIHEGSTVPRNLRRLNGLRNRREQKGIESQSKDLFLFTTQQVEFCSYG